MGDGNIAGEIPLLSFLDLFGYTVCHRLSSRLLQCSKAKRVKVA